MDVMEAIRKRRSIRRYEDTPVAQEIIDELLEAARLAPSAGNLQTWRFKVITEGKMKSALREAAFNQKFVQTAPVVIVACADFEAFGDRAKRSMELLRSGAVKPSLSMLIRTLRSDKVDGSEERNLTSVLINVSIAVEHMVLAATSMGLGTCWVRAFLPERVSEILSLPPQCPPLFLLSLGYPREDPEPRSRRTMEEILL